MLSFSKDSCETKPANMHETIVFLCYVWDVVVFRAKPSRSVRKLCWVCKSHAVTNCKTFEISKSFNQNFFSGDENWDELRTDRETLSWSLLFFLKKRSEIFYPDVLHICEQGRNIFHTKFSRTYKLVNINMGGRSVSVVKRNRNVI